MPRIQTAEFDQTPSTRVGANIAPQAPDAVNNVGKALASVTNAIATLQDQAERTEAYTEANKVKQDYLQKKVTYMAALESANGSGMADFYDPNDPNPDVSKRKRIQRPVQEIYQEMVAGYEEQKKQVSQLTRGDIANDLMRQYVGDDMIQLQMQTNKHLNRIREKEVEMSVNENLELNLSSFNDLATDPSASPEQIELGVAHMDNKIQREIATVQNVLGQEKTKDVHKLLDRAYSQFANNILSSGITDNTINAAYRLINKIRDPSQRTLAATRLENVRKATGDVKATATMNATRAMGQTIQNTAVLKNEDYAKAISTYRNAKSTYIDPKYSTLKPEDRDAAANDLLTTSVAKKFLQDNADTDLTYLFDPSKDKITEGPVADAPADGDWNAVYRQRRGNGGDSSKGIKADGSLVTFLKKHEGFRADAYDDGVGNTTIGFGRTTGDMTSTTPEREEEFLKERISQAETELSNVITRKDLTQGQMNVLVDMHYNLGLGNMQSFIEVVNNGTPKQIEESLKQYTKAKDNKTGELVELDGLVKRTASRLEMWRSPAGTAEGAFQSTTKTDKLREQIDRELDASGIAKTLKDGEREKVREDIISKMRGLHQTMKENIPDVVAANYPNLSPFEKVEKIHQIASVQGFGDPNLVGKKERTEFQAMFKSEMSRNPMGALGLLNQKLSVAGDAYAGEGSYKRAMAIDLADKDQNLAYLVPLADADPATQFKMIQNAAAYKRVIDETDVTPTDMQSNFETNKHNIAALQPLMRSNPSVYDGIKQAILHSAATRIQSKSDVNSAMKEAMKEMSELYSSGDFGGSSFFAVNRPAKDFGKVGASVISNGIKKATTLPTLTPDEKFQLLQRYNSKVIPKRDDGTPVMPSSEKMDWYIQRLVKIEPDGRYPNMHTVKINGADLSIGGKKIKISADEILEWGQQKEAEVKNSYLPNQGPMS